jgi:hypothetical protein
MPKRVLLATPRAQISDVQIDGAGLGATEEAEGGRFARRAGEMGWRGRD